MTTHQEVRKKYIEFFKTGDRKHKEIPSAPLIPENDPTTLFTSSGMQPLVPYLLGETHPLGTRLVNSQKSFRAQDIEEVGDNRHTTFFEMLGNWSLGDYFKKEQLPWFFAFLTKELGLDPKRLYVTVFEGNAEVAKDTDSVEIWKKIFAGVGIQAEVGKRIFTYPANKNWWSRSGPPDKMPPGEPGGPDSEVFFEFTNISHDPAFGKICHPNCDCGRFMEIGNSVFMQYQKQPDGSLKELPKKNVDFGGGLERLTAACNNDPDVFKTDIFQPLISALELYSNKPYGQDKESTNSMRIIADHIRAAVMMMSDGVLPGNKGQGAILRSLISKTINNSKKLNIKDNIIKKIALQVVEIYKDTYKNVAEKKDLISSTLDGEEIRFKKKIDLGINEINKVITRYPTLDQQNAMKLLESNLATYNIQPQSFLTELRNSGGYTSLASVAAGTVTFSGTTSYGLPLDYSEPIVKDWIGTEYNHDDLLRAEMSLIVQHKDLSRSTSSGMFKGGLQDHSDSVVKLHTATHLLQQALRDVLGNHVRQKGSNITGERLRFDFSHHAKLSEEEIRKTEEIVNGKIKANLPVSMKTMALEEAKKHGALYVEGAQFPDSVKVYSIGEYSKEICGGPHIDFTGRLGSFNIVKEEAAGAQTRRIYATLQNST